MRNIYNLVHGRSKEPFLKKENTFIFTDISPSSDTVIGDYFSRVSLRSSSNYEKGYDGAQRRFIESLFTMLDIKKEDEKVRWFMLTDDDHFMIPVNMMRTLAKYELKLEKGILSNEEPLIIGRTSNCGGISGGAGVIFNEKAIELLRMNIDKCIAKIGLRYYDYTIYRCVNDVLTKSTEEKCKILQHETSMHCCNYMYFCDPLSFNDPPNLSWFNRFRKATGVHYIQKGHVEMVRENFPESLFTEIGTCFSIEELETELDGAFFKLESQQLTIGEIVKKVEILGKRPEIDWSKKESQQLDTSGSTTFMKNLVQVIFTSWENQFASTRKEVSNLERKDIAVAIMPSSIIETRSRLISQDYNLQKSIESSVKYWTEYGFKVRVCSGNDCKISQFAECLQKTQDAKWTLVVTETTRSNMDLFLNYLKTYNNEEVLFVGGMSSALDLILSQLDKKVIGLPFGALFAVTQPFAKEFLSISSSSTADPIKQEKINNHLLVPNSKMMLSGGHFFKHAPEHYCTRGIQNLESWIEMQIPTKFLEPLGVTFQPTNNCPERMQTIDQFFKKVDRTLLTSKTVLLQSCFE